MEKTGKPLVAGILNIVAGVFSLIFAASYFVGFLAISGAMGIPGMGYVHGLVPGMMLAFAIPALLIAVLALVGGIFAVQRKYWGWSLAGSIAAILAFFPFGIASTILVAIAKNEF
jgi:hypothetical protein